MSKKSKRRGKAEQKLDEAREKLLAIVKSYNTLEEDFAKIVQNIDSSKKCEGKSTITDTDLIEILENGATELKTYTFKLTEFTTTCVKNMKYPGVSVYALKTELLRIDIQKKALELKIEALEIQKKFCKAILYESKEKKVQEKAAKVVAIMTQVSIIVTTIGEVLKILLNSIVGPIMIDARTMGLFMTPKSIMNLPLIPTNMMIDISIKLPLPVYVAMANITEGVKISNKGKMVAGMAMGAAMGMQLLNQPLLAQTLAMSLGLQSPLQAMLFKLVAQMFSMTISPEPMPKYEDLHPGNLSFMAWLIGTYEMQAKAAFGFPGFP